jgi:Polyketide cyclase / dehydrase and lipid transport
MLTQHDERSAVVQSSADRVFAYVDDHTRLSSHMSQSSWKMGGGRMAIELDEGRGQRVGSRIRLTGRVLGMALAVEEMVTERTPPHCKVWETTGTPKLVVIGHYRMGFEVTPQGQASRLRVFIDYALPERAPARWLGRVLGRCYARWCTQQMVDDAVKHFALVV